MDGEADTASGCSQRENKRSYKDLLIDEEEAESDAEEQITKRPHTEPNGSADKKMKHTDDTTTYPELHGAESSGFIPAYPVCVSQHIWTMKGEEENLHDNLLHPGCTAEGSTAQRTSSPMFGSVCGVISSAWNTFSSTSRSLHHSDQDPVSAAAHLHLLGESLSLIGLRLQETNKMVCMSSGFSLLLDSLLCALAPLICLTTQIPELKSCTRHTLGSTLENIAYVMPGL